LSTNASSTASSPESRPTRGGAFSDTVFTVIWCASMVSNFRVAMFYTALGRLMTNLMGDPMIVPLVQVPTSRPMFLFPLPAGALADLVDPPRLHSSVEIG